MENQDYLEDCTGHLWNRDHIPAEHDVYRKMKPVWKRLYYGNKYYCGKLLYEGFTVENMAYGAGTSYYGSGGRCQEGLFGPNGLVCGREYYVTGQLRFEGTYQYNPYSGQNWPIFGAYYDVEGELKHYGTFDVIEADDKIIRPFVMIPEEYGPVASVPFIKGWLFRGEKTAKYYGISSEFHEKLWNREKEELRKLYSREKILKRLRKYLKNPCPEYRDIAEKEIRERGAWTEEDQHDLERTQERCRPPQTGMTPRESYKRDLEVLDIHPSVLAENRERISSTTGGERNRLLADLCGMLESIYPYKWGRDPRHKQIGEPLEKRGIDKNNWLWKLDEMTDREISYMLDQEPARGRRDEERIACPEMTDRTRAEFMSAFGC